jgi:tape measure domain-containing protein
MEQFSKINASAQGTKLEGAGIQGVMTGIMEFARARNVDPEKMSLSMRAVGQMMSKGQVMMEELKNQFAEHLPGAMQLSAKAMGMTVKELYAAVEAGEVMAEDFLPKLAAEMARVARQGDALNKSLATSAAAQQGFNNKVTLFAEKIYKVIDPILARIFNNLAKWVDTIDAEAIGKVIELILVPISALINVFQILGNILAKITFDDFLNYLDEIGPLGIIAAAWLAKISGVLRVFTFALRFLNPVFGLIVAGITLLEDVLLYFFGDGLTNTVTGQLVKWLDDLYQQLKAKLASYSLLELANLLFNPAAAATKTRPNTETGVASPKPMTPKPVGLSPQNLENIKNYGVNSMLMAKQDKSSISNIQNVKITVQGNMDSQTANRLPGLLAIPQVPVPFKN